MHCRLEGTRLNRSISGPGLGTDAVLLGRGGSSSRRASLNILRPCQRESLGTTVLKGGLTFSSRVSPLRVLPLSNGDYSTDKTPPLPSSQAGRKSFYNQAPSFAHLLSCPQPLAMNRSTAVVRGIPNEVPSCSLG